MGEISGKLFPWNENNAKTIAEKPGVYGLYKTGNVLIYIGSSSNLRERFTHYWNTNFEEDKCKQATKMYKREFRDDYKSRERELLNQYQDENGKLPDCNDVIP